MDPVAWLARRYPTRTAVRALWRWSGGDPSAVDPVGDDPPWPRLWSLAESHDDGVSLLREALFDHPGDPDLLERLARLAERDVPLALQHAPDAVARFEALRPDFAPDGVRRVLHRLPASTAHDAFTAMAPVCEPWLPRPERERLAAACTVLIERDTLLASVLAMRRTAPSWEEAGPSLARLHELAAAAQDAWGRTVLRLEATASADRTPALVAQSLNAILNTPRGEEACGAPARVAALARGLRTALWGTHAEYADDEEPAATAAP